MFAHTEAQLGERSCPVGWGNHLCEVQSIESRGWVVRFCAGPFIRGVEKGSLNEKIAHFTVVCLVTWPWIGSEAGMTLFDTNHTDFHI